MCSQSPGHAMPVPVTVPALASLTATVNGASGAGTSLNDGPSAGAIGASGHVALVIGSGITFFSMVLRHRGPRLSSNRGEYVGGVNTDFMHFQKSR